MNTQKFSLNLEFSYFLFIMFLFLLSWASRSSYSFSGTNAPQKVIEVPELTKFSAVALNSTAISIQWEISGVYYGVNIYQLFINEVTLIGSFTDQISSWIYSNHSFGTYYEYFLEIVNQNGNVVYISENAGVITPLDFENFTPPNYSWQEYKLLKFTFFDENYLNYSETIHNVFNHTLHGVNVVIAIEKNVSDSLDKQEIFTTRLYHIFNQLWYKFQYFAVNEYRIVIEWSAPSHPGETELGLIYHPSEISWLVDGSGEKQSHEMCHAWIGGITDIERNLGGIDFDPVIEDSDKGIGEGLDSFYGNLGLGTTRCLDFINKQIIPYYEKLIADGNDLPLVDLPVHFGTPLARSYYVKGELFFLYLHKKMYNESSLTLNQFMQYWISKYNRTCPGNFQRNEYDVLTAEELLIELNTFTNLNFTTDFQDYVYGIERIPIFKVTYDDIASLMKLGDDISLVDKLSPVVAIISPQNETSIELTNSEIKLFYRISEANDYSVTVYLNGTILDFKSNGSTISEITSSGTYILRVAVLDKANNVGFAEILFQVTAKENLTSETLSSTLSSSLQVTSKENSTPGFLLSSSFFLVIVLFTRTKKKED